MEVLTREGAVSHYEARLDERAFRELMNLSDGLGHDEGGEGEGGTK